MKKLTLALVLIAAFCLFAVSPVVAAVTDPFSPATGNVTPKFTYGLAGKNVVSFPTATYKPSIAATLDKAFTVPSMTAIKTSTGGYVSVIKFPWEL
jgi:hypothetical protein